MMYHLTLDQHLKWCSTVNWWPLLLWAVTKSVFDHSVKGIQIPQSRTTYHHAVVCMHLPVLQRKWFYQDILQSNYETCKMRWFWRSYSYPRGFLVIHQLGNPSGGAGKADLEEGVDCDWRTPRSLLAGWVRLVSSTHQQLGEKDRRELTYSETRWSLPGALTELEDET